MNALVIRFGAIGDCIMAIPVAAAIRSRWPQSNITWAVEPRYAAVVDTNRLIDSLALFPRDDWEAARWSPRTWRDQVRRYLSFRRQHFDIGIDLHGRAKTALCLRLARPRKRISTLALDPVASVLNPVLKDAGPEHIVERNLRGLLTIADCDGRPHWIMPDLVAERIKVRALLPRGPIASITLTSGSVDKSVPVSTWREVAAELLKLGIGVVALGAPDDPHLEVENVQDLAGKVSLPEAMAVVAESRIHLAADTGLGHAAAAYGIPVVSVFRSTDPRLYRPYTQRGLVLTETASSQLSSQEIVQSAKELLERICES